MNIEKKQSNRWKYFLVCFCYVCSFCFLLSRSLFLISTLLCVCFFVCLAICCFIFLSTCLAGFDLNLWMDRTVCVCVCVLADSGAGPAAWRRSVSVSPSVHVVWTSAELVETRSQEKGTCVYHLTLPVRLQVWAARSQVRVAPKVMWTLGGNISTNLHVFHAFLPSPTSGTWFWFGKKNTMLWGAVHVIEWCRNCYWSKAFEGFGK